MIKSKLKGLYAITDRTLMPNNEQMLDSVMQAISGGASIIQYRDKSTDQQVRLHQAQQLVALCHKHDVLLLINDDTQLAFASGADGVHLGQSDGAITSARSLLGDKAIIGITCHDQLSLADMGIKDGADYIAFGAFFASQTKPNATPAPLSLLQDAKQRFNCPIVAIGGITVDNAQQIIAQGADMIAVIHALFAAPNIEKQAQHFSALFASHS